MTALVREEIPADKTVIEMFVETNDFVVIGIQIRRILVRSPLPRVVGREFVPFLAGDLTATTGCAA